LKVYKKIKSIPHIALVSISLPNRHSSVSNFSQACHIRRICRLGWTHRENNIFEYLCNQAVLGFDCYFCAAATTLGKRE